MDKDRDTLREGMCEILEEREPLLLELLAATMVYRSAMFVSGDAARTAREHVLLLCIKLSECRPTDEKRIPG